MSPVMPALALCLLLILVSRLLQLDLRRFALFFFLVFSVSIIILGPIISFFSFGLLWYFPVLPRSSTLYSIHLFHSYSRQSTAVLVTEVISLLFLLGFLTAGFGFSRCFQLPTKKSLAGVMLVMVCWVVLTAVLWGSIIV